MSARSFALAALLVLVAPLCAGPVRAQTTLLAQAEAAHETGDRPRAYALFEQACVAGVQEACGMQGFYLFKGYVGEADVDRGLRMAHASCDASSDRGCLIAGGAYYFAEVVPSDYPRALDLFTRGCRDGEGHAEACNNLGAMHERGVGTAIDLERAAEYYETACDMGSGFGCDNRGDLWREGDLGRADPEQALPRYRRGCERGHGEACLRAGLAFRRGEGVKADASQALYFYEQGCDLGNGIACYNAGLALKSAVGTAANPERAAALFVRACDDDFLMACAEAAMAYFAGAGVPVDRPRAFGLFQKACNADEEGERLNSRTCDDFRELGGYWDWGPAD